MGWISKRIKYGRIIALLLFALSWMTTADTSWAGWSHRVHINLLKEAIRILPYFEYQMCIYYKNHLMEGVVEGEIQYRYRDRGKGPLWLNTTNKKELEYLNGIPIKEKDIEAAAQFFCERLERCRADIRNSNRRYGDVLFELGYILHSINNVLIPLYEKGHFPEQRLAQQTESIDLRTEHIEEITDLKPWLSHMLKEKLRLRAEWSKTAEANVREAFVEHAHRANEKNIYVLAGILRYVLRDCFGPADPEVRKSLGEMHEKQLQADGGRKPWVELPETIEMTGHLFMNKL